MLAIIDGSLRDAGLSGEAAFRLALKKDCLYYLKLPLGQGFESGG